jgi:hypothetical protein
MRRSFLCCLSVCVLCVAVVPISSAQSTYGGIHGIVREASGEPVGDAVVIVTSVEKGTQLKLKTNRYGRFEFPQLLPESYDLTAESAGKKTTTQDISVVADDEAVVDPVLPRSKAETVGGAGSGSTLKTRADISLTLDRSAIENLPNFSQNFDAFFLLAPSAQIRNLGINYSQNPEQSILVSLNGNLPSGTALLLDGTDNRIPTSQISVINPPLESLSEIKITTQSYDAETGQALSGVIAAETRSGTNVWHGSLLDFRRSNWAAANNPDLQNPSLASVTPFRVDLFGGAVGGPILKNRLFVFADYQGTRSALSSTQFFNVPTQTVRNTCFSLTTQCDLSEYVSFFNSPIYDVRNKSSVALTPCSGGVTGTGGPKDGSCLPSGYVSSQASGLLSLLPPPNLGGIVNNYEISGAEAYNNDDATLRIDENLTRNLRLFGRYSFSDYRVNSPSGFGSAAGGPGFGPDGFAGTSRSKNHSLAAGFDYSLGANLFTDFRFGYYHASLQIYQNDYNTAPATDAGIYGLNTGDPLTSGMPAILIVQPASSALTTNINFGDGETVNACDCPLNERLWQFQFVNDWVKVMGKHTIKWGGDLRFARDFTLDSSPHRSGLITSKGSLTGYTPTKGSQLPPSEGLGLATYLMGYATSFSRTVGSIDNAGISQTRTFFYGQDTWRLSQRFTLNYGLRWEIYFPESVSGKNDGGFLDLQSLNLNVAGYPYANLQGNISNALTNLAPRIGLAYQWNPTTIIRAAYGRNFDAASPAVYGTGVAENPPVQYAQSELQGGNHVGPKGNSQLYVFQFGDQAQCQSNSAQCLPTVQPILFPNLPASGQIPATSLVNVSVYAVPAQLRVPTLDQWNLTVQHELAPKMYLEIGYLGNKGTHLPLSSSGTYDLNEATINGYASYGCYMAANATMADCLGRHPFYSWLGAGNPGWTQQINYSGDDASSNYNSLQARLVKSFSSGYQFQASYVWAKGLGYDSDYYNQDPKLDYGVNTYDRRHTFTFFNVLYLPFGKGKSIWGSAGTVANYLVGGWALNTVTTWASGLPFSPTYNPSECNFDRDTGPCRPNIVGEVHIIGDRNDYFTTTGGQKFTRAKGSIGPSADYGPWQEPAVGTFGTASNDSLRGPSFFDTDAAITKDIPVSERFRVQFRTDFLNVFNRVNLGLPDGCVDCETSGQQTGAVITTLAPNASQRQIEFALRVQF